MSIQILLLLRVLWSYYYGQTTTITIAAIMVAITVAIIIILGRRQVQDIQRQISVGDHVVASYTRAAQMSDNNITQHT